MYIKREKYLELLRRAKDKKIVKILIGVRRSGKTSILNMFIEELQEIGIDPANIVHINFEKKNDRVWMEENKLHDFIEKKASKDTKIYLFIDEIQEMDNWALIINSLRTSYNIDIYVTGSNSHLFSGEHLTYLGGRFISIEVFPLSFKEFIAFGNHKEINKHLYDKYINCSFPEVVIEDDEKIKSLMVTNLKESIFERDVIIRARVRDKWLFEKVVSFIYDSVSKRLSTKKIHDTLLSSSLKTTTNTIENYFTLLKSAYLLYFCPRYEESGRKLLKTNGKFYSVDVGLADALSSPQGIGRGQKLENFIFLELIKQGWRVYTVNVNRDYEIDFFAYKNDEKMYIQVAEYIENDDTWNREIRPFKYLKTNYQRYVVSFDEILIKSPYCEHINVFDFVLKKI